jgi:hypothetical protein
MLPVAERALLKNSRSYSGQGFTAATPASVRFRLSAPPRCCPAAQKPHELCFKPKLTTILEHNLDSHCTQWALRIEGTHNGNQK